MTLRREFWPTMRARDQGLSATAWMWASDSEATGDTEDPTLWRHTDERPNHGLAGVSPISLYTIVHPIGICEQKSDSARDVIGPDPDCVSRVVVGVVAG